MLESGGLSHKEFFLMIRKEGLLSWLPLRKHITAYGYSYPYFQMIKIEASDAEYPSHWIKFLAFMRMLFGDIEIDRLILYAMCKTKMQSTLASYVPVSFSIWKIS